MPHTGETRRRKEKLEGSGSKRINKKEKKSITKICRVPRQGRQFVAMAPRHSLGTPTLTNRPKGGLPLDGVSSLPSCFIRNEMLGAVAYFPFTSAWLLLSFIHILFKYFILFAPFLIRTVLPSLLLRPVSYFTMAVNNASPYPVKPIVPLSTQNTQQAPHRVCVVLHLDGMPESGGECIHINPYVFKYTECRENIAYTPYKTRKRKE